MKAHIPSAGALAALSLAACVATPDPAYRGRMGYQNPSDDSTSAAPATQVHSTVPLVVEIPGPAGVPEGEPSLSDLVLKAIGIKL